MNYIKQNKKIEDLLKNHKTDKAIIELKKQIYNKKNVGINALILSEIYSKEKNFPEAINILEEKNIYIDPRNNGMKYDYFDMLGDHYYRTGNYQRSLLNYQQALKMKQIDYRSFAKIGLIYTTTKQLGKAADIFEMLLKKYPDNNYYNCLYAYLFIESHQYKKARDLLNRVMKHNKEYSYANYYMGYLFYCLEKYYMAEDYLKRASRNGKLKFDSNYHLGKIFMKRSNYKTAIEYFNIAKIAIGLENKTTLDLHYSLNHCYEKIDNYHNGYIELMAINKMDPKYRDVRTKLQGEKYKYVSNKYLIDYEGSTKSKFYELISLLLYNLNLTEIDHRFLDYNLLIANAKVNVKKAVTNHLSEYINYSKNEKVLIIFSRKTHITEQTIGAIIKKLDHKSGKCIFITSSDISSIAIDYAIKKNIKIIDPILLNDIMKELKI